MVGPFFQETVPSKEMEQKTGPCAFCTKEEELEDHWHSFLQVDSAGVPEAHGKKNTFHVCYCLNVEECNLFFFEIECT